MVAGVFWTMIEEVDVLWKKEVLVSVDGTLDTVRITAVPGKVM